MGIDYIDNQLEENCDSTGRIEPKRPAWMRGSVRMEEIYGTFFLQCNIHCYLVERHYVSRVSGC